jgi:hypothetical protein
MHTTVDRGVHGGWDREWWVFDRELSGNCHRGMLDDVRGRFVSNQGDGSALVTMGSLVRWRTVGDRGERWVRGRDAPPTSGRMPALLIKHSCYAAQNFGNPGLTCAD